MFDHQIHKLKSGVTVITIPMPSVESVTVLAMSNVGSRYETPKTQGIAHFLEHMVFKGTANYPDAQAIALAIDSIGADANAFTSKEYTGYYVKSASRHISKALDVVSDMLLTPKLDQEEIDKEKGVIIEEINMYNDTPTQHISDVFEEMFFAGSGLGHDVAGTKASVSGVSRKDFVEFLGKWYGPGNLVLILAGRAKTINSKETLELADQAFSKGSSKSGSSTRVQEKVELGEFLGRSGEGETSANVATPYSDQRLVVEHKATEQAHLIMGWPGIKRGDDRRHVLSVLGVAMGGNMSSRLFTEVREKRGLCYYVRCDVDYYHDGGVFGASAGVDPKRIDEALSVMKGEFVALAAGERPITKEELANAKEFIMGTTVLGFEDSRSVAQYFGLKQTLMSKIEPPQVLLDKIMAVTLDEVNQLACDLVVDGQLRLAIIGPFEDKSRFERYL